MQKRIHNPGWNIEWDKSYRVDESSNKEGEIIPKQKSALIKVEKELVVDSHESTRILFTPTVAIKEAITPSSQRLNQPESIEKSRHLLKEIDSKSKRKSTEIKTKKKQSQIKNHSRSKSINWELIGQIGASLLILLIIGLFLFGTGPWATIAGIIIAIGYTALIIAATIAIFWFFWYVLFGWM